MARQLEHVAGRSYGLYLTNLIVLDLSVFLVQLLLPGLLAHQLAFCIVLFVVALGVPLGVMDGVARSPTRMMYRYVFG